MSKKVLITQSNYIPWRGYFDAIRIADEFIVYDTVQYTRRDWRNRNIIKTKDGLKWLTIPVRVKGKFMQKINEVETAGMNWKDIHWKTICQNYAKARCFKQYEQGFQNLYHDIEDVYLSKINYFFIKHICSILNITTPISYLNDDVCVSDKTERLIEICKQHNATEYLTGPAAKNYLNESLFQDYHIKVTYLDYKYPPYDQLYGSYVEKVSVIDLIFNEGSSASMYMSAVINKAQV